MAIQIEQKAIESNSNPTLNHLMLCSSEIEANTLTLASLGFHFWSPFSTFDHHLAPGAPFVMDSGGLAENPLEPNPLEPNPLECRSMITEQALIILVLFYCKQHRLIVEKWRWYSNHWKVPQQSSPPQTMLI